MSSWWRKSSSKEAKIGENKANLGGIFGLIRKKLKFLSESMQKSSRTRQEIVSEVGYDFQAFLPSTPVTQFRNVDEVPQSYPLPLPVNVSDTGRVELGKQGSRDIGHSKGSSEFVFPVLESNLARNGHDPNNVEGNLVTDYQTSTCSHSSDVITTQKKREKRKQVKPKQLTNLQIPQSGGFCTAPEPGQNDFWAMRPSADPGFLGPGPSFSPGSAHTSQLSWQNRCTPERVSPIPSPGPSPRKQSGPPSADPGFLGPGPSYSPRKQSGPSSADPGFLGRGPSSSPRIQSGPSSADPGFLAPGPSSSPRIQSGPSSADSGFLSPGPSSSPRIQSGSPSADPGFFGPGPSFSPSKQSGPSSADPGFLGLGPSSSPRIQSGPPSAESGFLVPGPSSSSGSGYNAIQLFQPNSRCTPESGSPIPSPRMTSPGPSPRRHIGPPSANWPDDAVNGKHQAHRLPLPPRDISNTGRYSPRTTPSVPRSPGRADLVASPGSCWKKGHLLGKGTYGHVYLGFDSQRGEMCAMKELTLSPDDERLKENVQQLGQEITRLSSLRHPNIVQYYGFETVDNKLYIYLEYVGGGSIYKILQEHGAFSECIIRNYTRQILQGLAFLHSKNMVHRDIKGANILVDAKGHIKLTDYCVAKYISWPSSALSLKGSANWMAPELINNTTNDCGLRVDIWSLGCTVQEMATTKPPWSDYKGAAATFKVLNSKEIKPPNELSDEGKDFVLQCMQRDPSLRPSAAQLLNHPFVKNIPENSYVTM